MFLKRSTQKELMDDFSIVDERIDTALNELNIINKYLGGTNITKKALKKFSVAKNDNLKIIDIGGGGSDNFYFLKDTSTSIYNLDLNIQACKFTSQKKFVKSVCANVNHIPFKEKSSTVINSSLFFHHFSEEEIIKILTSVKIISIKGIIINDLRRNIIALWAIKFLTHLFSKSEMVKNDAPLSVRRGFIKSEIKNILLKCGFNNYEIKRKWAFRWLVIIYL